MGEALTSYAADINVNEQNSDTNVSNVKFDVYFDATDKTKKEVEKDINTEGLKLYVSVDVKNGGYLSGGQIEFTNCNFRLKNNQDKIELDSIQSGKSKEYLVEVVAKKDDLFDLNLLDMISQIKLDAEYRNNEGNAVHVESTKNVKISWTADSITEENSPIKLSQEVITNKIYNIGGTNRRIIQLELTSGIENNQYPIKSTEIELNVPALGELYPEKVVVASYDTIATNGKNSTEFGKIKEEPETEDLEEGKLGLWKYDENEHKVNIVVNNDPVENKVSWAKNGEDKFIVTYVYDENASLESFTSSINSKIFVYEAKNEVKELTKTSDITEENMQEAGDAISLDLSATNTIYKSNMNLNQETEFNTKWTIQLGCSDIVKETLIIGNYGETLLDGENSIDANTYYKSTYINKEELLNVLGAEGELIIGAENINLEDYIIINKDSTVDENGNICINYSEDNKIRELLILITKPVSEGKLNITHTRMLDTSSLSKEQIDSINKLTTNASLFVDLSEEEEAIATVEAEKTADINIQEPKTEVAIGIDKEKLSTTQENGINLTVTLKADDLKYRLYKNPTIEVALPEEVEKIDVQKENINISNANGLTLKDVEVIGKTMKITLEGEQAQYIGQDVQVLVNAKVQTTKLLPTIQKDIIVKCINEIETRTEEMQEVEAETVQNSCTIELVAEQGILLANSISNYNGEEPKIEVFKDETKIGLLSADSEEIIATGKSTIINNTEEKLENVIVIGKNPIQVTMENAEIYYTKDEEISLNSNWIEEYSEDVTGYKVILTTLEKGEVLEIPYTLKISAQKGTQKTIELEYAVYSGTNQLANAPKIILETAQEVKLSLEVEPAVANNQTIFEGNVLSYNIKVTNIGDCIARNVQISNTIPEGTTIVEGYENSWTAEELLAGETVTKTIKVKVNTLANEETQKTITNTTTVTARYLKEELKESINNIVKKASVKVDILDGYNDGESIYENGQAFYEAIITNTSETDLNNVTITSYIPENTTYVVDGVEANGIEVNTKKEENKIIYEIDKLEKGKTVIVKTKVKVGEIPDNQNSIIYKIEIDSDEMEVYTTERTDEIARPQLKLEYSSKNKTDETRNKVVNAGDVLEYSAEITNLGNKDENILIEGNISTALICDNIKYTIDGSEPTEVQTKGGTYKIYLQLNKNQSVTISMTATVVDIKAEQDDINIANTINCAAKIYDREGFGEDKYVNGLEKTIEYVLEAEKKDSDDSEDPVDPNDPEKALYKIAGLAWLDENENGEQEQTEKLLKEITVKIKDAKTNEYLKDKNGKQITATTNEKGEYEFKDLKAGKYTIEFEYNNNTYKLTPQKGKDSVANVVTIDKNTIITTEVITITNKNISNINIGLVLNPIYDLKLDKYVTKVTVQNSAGTKVYNYDKEQLAKVEIKSKNLEGSIVIVEYTIEVTNNGAVPGYVKTIADYLAPEFRFNSELNTSWYQGTDNNLYCVELANDVIKPGESKQVKLVLTKRMTSKNTGLVNNTAEIYEDFNEYALEDINSIAGNKKEKENDMSKADLIITVSTGSPIMYIGIVIGSMVILGAGIYLINKKVIKRMYI